MAVDVAQQQQVVSDCRAALALRRRFRPRNSAAMIRLEAGLAAAERHLAVLRHRQAAWQRDQTFERDLVERVLLMARIDDLREASARALRSTREAVASAPPGYVWVGTDRTHRPPDDRPGGTTLAALTGYLRKYHPPVD